jgi:tRNA A22 N-methylase
MTDAWKVLVKNSYNKFHKNMTNNLVHQRQKHGLQIRQYFLIHTEHLKAITVTGTDAELITDIIKQLQAFILYTYRLLNENSI